MWQYLHLRHWQVLHGQAVIVFAPFALGEYGLGNFFDGDVGKGFFIHAMRAAADKKRAVVPQLYGDMVEHILRQKAGGHVNEVAFRALSMHPEGFRAGGVGEVFQLAHGFGEHFRVELRVDDRVAPGVFFDEAWPQAVKAEAPAPLPAHGLGDAAGVFAVDNLVQARHTVGVAVLAKLNAYPAAAHFVGYGCRGAGTEEGVENKVAGVGGNMENAV